MVRLDVGNGSGDGRKEVKQINLKLRVMVSAAKLLSSCLYTYSGEW